MIQKLQKDLVKLQKLQYHIAKTTKTPGKITEPTEALILEIENDGICSFCSFTQCFCSFC